MLKNKQLLLLILIFLIYGTFSSPTPDDPGLWEAIIGTLLVLLAGRGVITAIGGILMRRPIVPGYVIISFAWLLIVPSVVGILLRGNDLTDFVRDFLPFFYLTLPLFLARRISENPESWKNVLQWGLVYVGLAFAVRFYQVAEGEIWVTPIYDFVGYFNQDPAVLFSATFLTLGAVNFLYERRWLSSIAALITGGFIYSSVAFQALRAQIILVVLALFVLYLYTLWRYPGRLATWVPLFGLAVGFLTLSPMRTKLLWVIEMINAKTEAAGVLNMRNVEIYEVLQHFLSRIDLFLFGDGWGAKLYMSTSDSEVRFTHAGLTYFIWKSGLIGVMALLAIIYWIVKQILLGWRYTPKDGWFLTFWLSCFNAVFAYFFIEPGYKMLTFGFVLCLIFAESCSRKSNQRVEVRL